MLDNSGNNCSNMYLISSSGSGCNTIFVQNLPNSLAIVLALDICVPSSPPINVSVAMIWKLFEAMMVSPRPGMNSFLVSSNGSITDITSTDAKSISSINIHFPSCTAFVKAPACHLNSPGVSVHTYVPSNTFASD